MFFLRHFRLHPRKYILYIACTTHAARFWRVLLNRILVIYCEKFEIKKLSSNAEKGGE